jgi:hypothetical protein
MSSQTDIIDLAVMGGDRVILLQGAAATELLPAARAAQKALAGVGARWAIHAGVAPDDVVGARIVVQPAAGDDPRAAQSYTLTIDGAGIVIRAGGPAGAFYGAMTLTQLLRQRGREIPHLRIEDRPDFVKRGVMLDVSRDKVPTMATLLALVDQFAELKMNELQLYTEHTFTFRRHPAVWADASPFTGEEILQLDQYCRERFIELTPNLNTFGHMRRWLTLPQYRDLAECPDGCDTRWGRFDQPFTLNPGDPRSLALVQDMLDETLPHFTSDIVNVGGDETVDLGQGRSRERVAELGVGRVYLEFLKKIHAEVVRRGRRMQFWGDIIMEHPELVDELPKDIVALEWGYEFDHPFAEHGARFAASGIPFYVCPGTSAWNSLGGRTENMLGNIRSAAENGLRYGAIGLLNTDWGDAGHLQPLPVSFLGYAYGAAVSWCVATNVDADIAHLAGVHVFRDYTGAAGRFAYEVGNVYRALPRTHNSTGYALAVLRREPNLPTELRALDADVLGEMLSEIERLSAQRPKLRMERDDAAVIRAEYAHVLNLMRYGVQRLRYASVGGQMPDAEEHAAVASLIDEHDRVWLMRNRRGGMNDSAANLRFESDGN